MVRDVAVRGGGIGERLGLDRGREPDSDVATAATPAQRVDTEARGDPHQPRLPVGRWLTRRPLDGAEKRLLYQIVGVCGAAGEPVAQSPQSTPVGLEDWREIVRVTLAHSWRNGWQVGNVTWRSLIELF